jgi:hypothetical protein
MTKLPSVLDTASSNTIVSRKDVFVRSIKVPVLENTFDGYFSNRVDLKLTNEQTQTLKSVLFGLQSKYTKLANGKEITNGADAIKWILEEMTVRKNG